VGLVLALAALGCNPGGVGDPCTPEDEYRQNFNGFQVTETNAESRSFQCETRLCLVNHFQGRVSCRLGQGDPKMTPTFAPRCSIPGTRAVTAAEDPNAANHPDNIQVEVPPELVKRQTDQAVYCSCRCDGPEANARYCECPEGFQCEPLVDDLQIPGSEKSQLPGSYCIRAGSKYDPGEHVPRDGENCANQPNDCGCDPGLEDDKYPPDCGAR
jgi:hypothetical protein